MKSFLDFLKENETPDLPYEEAAKEKERQERIAAWEAKHDKLLDQGRLSTPQIINKIGPKPA